MSKTHPTVYIERLSQWLKAAEPVGVAVSGGVDSLTLGLLAARVLGPQARCFHALSPAVPPVSTSRVWRMAAAERWILSMLDAGEFQDPAYRENPLQRCYYCKSHLYAAIAHRHQGDILSGTNLDDLNDTRPGLKAAAEHGVRHPYVDCGLDKQAVRAICRHLGYAAVAELPASPCLSSRMETGLPIEAAALQFIDRVERLLRKELRPQVVRCRILHDAVAVQLDTASLSRLQAAESEHWNRHILALSKSLGLPQIVRFEPYRMGSAFVDVR